MSDGKTLHEENETLHDRKNERRRQVLQGVCGDAVNNVSAILKSGSARIKNGSAKNEFSC